MTDDTNEADVEPDQADGEDCGSRLEPQSANEADVEPDQADGIACPKCAVKLLVTLTRPAAPGLKVRYVRCPKCRLTARTEERIVRTFEAE